MVHFNVMMSKSTRPYRLFRQAAGWLLCVGFMFGVYCVYRWAEPSPASLAALLTPHTSNINLELEGAAFENFADGYKNWSLWAGRIVLERPTGGQSNSLQSADIENIRDGKLFVRPEGAHPGEGAGREQGTGNSALQHPTPAVRLGINTQHLIPDSPLTQSSTDAATGPPAATFAAKHGRYLIGSTEGVPTDMLLTYSIIWQFKLTGDVQITTREGYDLNAPSILMLEMLNRRTGKVERQMLCEQGARFKAKGATVQANLARYDDKNQTVECLGGVRATMQQDTVQAEAFHWSLKDDIIRCPEMASGTWQKTPFTARNLLIDVKHHRYLSEKLRLELSQDDVMNGKLP